MRFSFYFSIFAAVIFHTTMKHFFVILLLMGGLPVFAQNTLNVWLTDGGKVSFTFAEKPVVSHADNILSISSTAASVEYPVSDVVRFTFEDAETTKVLSVKSDIADEVSVFDLQGTLLKRFKGSSFSLEGLPQGVYIIKSNRSTFKVIKK